MENQEKNFSAVIDVHKLNETWLAISSDQEGVLKELSEYFSFYDKDYQFKPSYKSGIWDGKIRLLTREAKLYTGLLPFLSKFAKDREIRVRTHLKASNPEKSSANGLLDPFIESLSISGSDGTPIQPYEYQKASFEECVFSQRRLIVSPTASGKSLIIYLLSRFFAPKRKVLIIVPKVSLTLQMRGDFLEYAQNTSWGEENIHCIYEGQDKFSEAPIQITTWQSVYKMGEDFFNRFQVVIADECHQYKSHALRNIIEKCENVKFRYGFTGSLDDIECHELILQGLFGLKYIATTTAKEIEKGRLSKLSIKVLSLAYSDEERKHIAKRPKDVKSHYFREVEWLAGHEKRNKFIGDLALNLKGNTLILFRLVEKHGKPLYELVKGLNSDESRKVFFVYGGTKAEQKDAVRGIVEKENNAIIIASYGTYSTGVNIKRLHSVIFASPSKSQINVMQSIGRSLRTGKGKSEATLYDIVDDLKWKSKVNYSLDHFSDRLAIYIKEKHPYSIHSINFSK